VVKTEYIVESLVAIEGLFTYNLGMLIVKGHRYYRYNCGEYLLQAMEDPVGGGGYECVYCTLFSV